MVKILINNLDVCNIYDDFIFDKFFIFFIECLLIKKIILIFIGFISLVNDKKLGNLNLNYY